MRKIDDLISLEGRVAAVTGGAGHIGRAIAETFAELGASVAIVDHPAAAPADAAKALDRDFGGRTAAIDADLAHEDQVRAVPSRIARELGGLDILVNCAAYVGTSDLPGWGVGFNDQSTVAWRAALEVNLTAPFILSQAAAELLGRSGQGSIINVGSIYGVLGPDWRLYEGTSMANPAAYAASKGGLMQLTRWLATTLAPAIRVNAIVPGGVARQQPESFVRSYVARTPLGRMAREEDFKGAAAYLAGDMSAYVTGQLLVVDGGWSAW